MLTLYKPTIEDLWFKEKLLGDEETMAYNRAWGGTIPFPREKWAAWHRRWLEASESERYYRYLYDTESRSFVGEIAYHLESERNIYLCDVIVLACMRHKGFGTEGLMLLCQAAKENGIRELHDDIALDNPSLSLFLKNGFIKTGESAEAVTVKKNLMV